MTRIKPLLCAAISLLAAAIPLAAQQRVVLLPGANVSQFPRLYTAELEYRTDLAAAPGGVAAFSNSTATRYYVVTSNAGAAGVSVLQANGAQAQTPISVGSGEPHAAVTPDLSRLLVLTSALHILNIQGDTPNVLGIANVGSGPVDLAVSLDGRRAFVLSPLDQRLYTVDLTTNATLATALTVPSSSTAVSVGPNGLVYVTATGQVIEIDGNALRIRNTINVSTVGAILGKAAFTPDGSRLVVGNRSGIPAAFVIDLPARTVTPVNSPGGTMDPVVVPDVNRFFGVSDGKLYVKFFLNSGPAQEASFSGGATLVDVTGALISNEATSAANLYVTHGTNELTRIRGGLAIEQPATGGASASFVSSALTGNIVNVIQVNATQTVAPGGSSIPLVIRAADQNGVPVSGAAVTWLADPSLTPQAAATTSVTNAEGYAVAVFTAPAAVGEYPVIGSVGGQSKSYTITVAGSDGGGGDGGGDGGGGGGGTTGGVVILSGQGQVLSLGLPAGSNLSVQVRDAAGNPVPGATVTWNLTESPAGTAAVENTAENPLGCAGTAIEIVCTADNEGKSSIRFRGQFIQPLQPYFQITITASATGPSAEALGSATFYGTVLPLTNGNQGQTQQAAVALQAPEAGTTVQIRAGQTLPGAVRVAISAPVPLVAAIPNAGIEVTTVDAASGGPSVSCVGGAALSNTEGIATCDLIAGTRLGQSTLIITIGGTLQLRNVFVQVIEGAASKINILAGNNQSGNPGQVMPQQLLAEITDAGGNVLRNLPATWTVLTAGGATVSPATSTSDANGRVSTRVTLGTTPGPVEIRVTSGEATATFTVTVNVSVTGITIASGNNQTAVINTAFPNPIVVQVNSAQGPLPSFPVTFALASGSAVLSAASATTDAAGQASITVTAGPQAGPIAITATAAGMSQTFNLTARTPGPVLTLASILNSGSFQPGQGVAFGSIVSIVADGVASGINMPVGSCIGPSTIQGPLPTRLAGVEVQFAGHLAPLFHVCRGVAAEGKDQVTVQAPFELAPAQISVIVRTGVGTTAAAEARVDGLRILPTSPGIFQFVSAGAASALATRPDGSLVTQANPAQRGEVIRVFVTGLGPVLPSVRTNQAGVPGQVPYFRASVQLRGAGIGGVTAEYAENMIGVFVVTFPIPADATAGEASLVITAVTDSGEAVNSPASRIFIQ